MEHFSCFLLFCSSSTSLLERLGVDMNVLEALNVVFDFLARLGGFLAFLFFLAMGVKFWMEADQKEEETE